MKKKYTEEHKEFFLSFVPGHTDKEVATEFSSRFGISITPSQVKSYKHNNHMQSGTSRGKPKGTNGLFPAEIREFVRENNYGKTAVQMQELVNRKFGRKYSLGQIKTLRSRMHLISGLTGRFEKGSVPFNKGKKGVCFAGCERTWFKKGHTPHNAVPVDTEVMTTDGYLKVKTGEPDVWQYKHIMEWKKHHGEIPAGCCISFKDGNPRNCAVENLMCITRAENAILNRQHLRSCSAELTESGLVLAKLKHKIREIQKERGYERESDC